MLADPEPHATSRSAAANISHEVSASSAPSVQSDPAKSPSAPPRGPTSRPTVEDDDVSPVAPPLPDINAGEASTASSAAPRHVDPSPRPAPPASVDTVNCSTQLARPSQRPASTRARTPVNPINTKTDVEVKSSADDQGSRQDEIEFESEQSEQSSLAEVTIEYESGPEQSEQSSLAGVTTEYESGPEQSEQSEQSSLAEVTTEYESGPGQSEQSSLAEVTTEYESESEQSEQSNLAKLTDGISEPNDLSVTADADDAIARDAGGEWRGFLDIDDITAVQSEPEELELELELEHSPPSTNTARRRSEPDAEWLAVAGETLKGAWNPQCSCGESGTNGLILALLKVSHSR